MVDMKLTCHVLQNFPQLIGPVSGSTTFSILDTERDKLISHFLNQESMKSDRGKVWQVHKHRLNKKTFG